MPVMISGDPQPAATFVRCLETADDMGVNDFILGGEVATADCIVYRVDNVDRFSWKEAIISFDLEMSGSRHGKVLLLDCSAEGFEYDPAVMLPLLEVASEIKSFRKIIFLTHNHDLIEKLNGFKNPRLVALYFHYFFYALVYSVQTNLGKDYVRRLYKDKKNFFRNGVVPPKRYSCLINRNKPHRMAIYGWLKKNDLLRLGNVSFHSLGSQEEKSNFQEALDASLSNFPSFQPELELFADSLREFPFRNFESDGRENFVVSFNIPAYSDAPLSLVAESEMSRGERDRFTEKTLKSIIAGHRLLVAGNPGTLSRLRSLGFKTLMPQVNESYDEVTNPDRRLGYVLQEFEKYMSLTDAEFRDFIVETWESCETNIDIFIDVGRQQVQSWFAALSSAIEV